MRAFPMNAACFLVVSWIIQFGNQFNSMSIELHTTDINFIGHITSHDELYRRKLHIIKSLTFSGAFNEAVCTSELIELVNDLYDDHDFYNTTTSLITHNNNGNKYNKRFNVTSSSY